MTTWDDFQKTDNLAKRKVDSLELFVTEAYIKAAKKTCAAPAHTNGTNAPIYDFDELDKAGKRDEFMNELNAHFESAAVADGINGDFIEKHLHIISRYGYDCAKVRSMLDTAKSNFKIDYFKETVKQDLERTISHIFSIASSQLNRADIPTSLANYVNPGLSPAVKTRIGDWNTLSTIAAYQIYRTYSQTSAMPMDLLDKLEEKGILRQR